MPRASLSKQSIVRAGLNASYTVTTAADGAEFANTGVEFVHVKNPTVGTIVVTFVTTQTVDGLAVADRTVSVPASGERFIGPFPVATYGSTVTVNFDVDGAQVAVLSRG